MTNEDKRRFISELIENVCRDALAKVADMPEEWDGHELRRYLADKFEEAAMTVGPGRPSYKKRYRAYRNEVLVRNL